MYNCCVSVCINIAKIVYSRAFEIKLTVESNLFKNDCLFIHRIQQRIKLKYIGRLTELCKKKIGVFFLSMDFFVQKSFDTIFRI